MAQKYITIRATFRCPQTGAESERIFDRRYQGWVKENDFSLHWLVERCVYNTMIGAARQGNKLFNDAKWVEQCFGASGVTTLGELRAVSFGYTDLYPRED